MVLYKKKITKGTCLQGENYYKRKDSGGERNMMPFEIVSRGKQSHLHFAFVF